MGTPRLNDVATAPSSVCGDDTAVKSIFLQTARAYYALPCGLPTTRYLGVSGLLIIVNFTTIGIPVGSMIQLSGTSFTTPFLNVCLGDLWELYNLHSVRPSTQDGKLNLTATSSRLTQTTNSTLYRCTIPSMLLPVIHDTATSMPVADPFVIAEHLEKTPRRAATTPPYCSRS
ncbi:hypothetical protein HYPSUDRAFT_209161 [Hypholoma sublateritium FD-334 SS-4]|uniref:Uncharacterized protein n=1 Tax=Hypholoma sublateritium (strain FD-334 SS-4) TaxID=945553 RepID=A0A0D2LSR3_HYPSF|nr:hypothetical protein HYPSUDRAFT_209161 [Hypholoma sublateritium FD-334 SS-4]